MRILGAIYRAIYSNLVSRKDVFSITVESPNDAFSALRDICDLQHLMAKEAFITMPIPFDDTLLKDAKRNYKLSKVM
jgi:histone acetyltransferase 1